ncbi:hypothetical protein PRIPAC_93377 [Pristionchus pacificus]|uniref:CUE domain-containing protein n=1 Tax=Pristionchus pacificus TaxID=54126 RepID=A0A2A6CHE3_PRIPA|nr:hypothetical protein PRIPAC_93377 [Pristionchus pacificus]|eukprot:PDM77516.1 hypothetical protein PRIPAC_34383 [Pristionchus pacificus]
MWKSQQDGETTDPEALPQDAVGSSPWITASTRFIDRLLMLPSTAFWSKMADGPDVLNWLDDVSAWIPRPYELDRLATLNVDGDVLASVRLLKGSFLALFFRLAVYDREKDGSMNAAENKRNRTMFAKALRNAANTEGSTASEDIIKLEEWQIGELADLRKDVDRIAGAWNSARGVKRAAIAEIALQFLEGAVDWLYSTCAFYRVAEAAKLRYRPHKLAPEIASMVEHFSAFLTTDNTQEIAMHLADYPLRRVFRLRTQLEQFGVELVHDLLVEASADKRPTIVNDLLVCERFLYALNDAHQLREMMLKGTMSQKDNVAKILETVRVKQEKATLSEMSRLGLVKNLGSMSSMPQRVAVAVDEVMAIFPHLSTAYVHACLRHVGYDSAEAIDMIVSERVPGWLRRLEGPTGENERMKDGGSKGGKTDKRWFERMEESATGALRPPIVFDHEDCDLVDVLQSSSSSRGVEKEKGEEERMEEERNMFKGIFSLAPAQKKAEPAVKKDEDAARSSRAAAQAASSRALASIREGLERMKVHAHGEDEAFGMENERLVAMKGSKTHATADKYRTSAADQASLRPFYERFKYETDERDEDVYNDEYDDGYEEKAFKTDPLTNDIASSDEEKDKAEERGKGGGMERGGARGGRGGGYSGPAAAPTGYTGGRQRQVQERNKNKFRQRGADRKAARGMI